MSATAPVTRALVAGGVALALLVNGCSPVHFNRPGRTAACAVALPVAFATVHDRGQLVGFRVVRRRGDLRRLYLAIVPRALLGGLPAPAPGSALTAPRGPRIHPAAIPSPVAPPPGAAPAPGAPGGHRLGRAVRRGVVQSRRADQAGLHRLGLAPRRNLRRTPAAVGPAGEPPRAVCVAVFRGTYTAAQVASAPAGDRGRYAVLVIFVRHAAIVHARLLDALPAAVRALL